MLKQNLLHPLWLVGEFWMVGWEDHGLDNFCAIMMIKPPSMHMSLHSTWSQIHLGYQ
jgi:hypothetical protein